MLSEDIKAFESGMREIVNPEMKGRAFKYDSSTRTFRKVSGDCIQIVTFQVGTRTMAGKFTVNLAVFHPDYCEPAARGISQEKPRDFDCLMEFRERLSALRDTPFTRFFKIWIHTTDSFIKWWLVTPIDKWWNLSSDSVQIAKELGFAKQLLFTRGIEWLEGNSDVALLKSAYEKLSLRQNR